jgi:hypothetical protein
VGIRPGKFSQGLVAELKIYAEYAFRIGAKQADGATAGDHLASGAEQMRKFGLKPKQHIPTADDAPPFPAELGYLWEWFNEHTSGLVVSGMAMPVVTWESLHAWSRITRIDLDAWEARAMIELGAIRAIVEAKKT